MIFKTTKAAVIAFVTANFVVGTYAGAVSAWSTESGQHALSLLRGWFGSFGG